MRKQKFLFKSITFLETFIYMLEEKNERFLNPSIINYAIIIISFTQIFGNSLNLTVEIYEKKFLVLQKIIKYIQITPTLRNLSNDSFSIGILLVHQFFTLFLIIYFLIFTTLRYKHPIFISRYSLFFKKCNMLLNYFLITFNWLFMYPMLSFLLSFIVCNNFSVISTDRNNICDFSNPYKIFALLSFIIYCFLSFVIEFFIDNYYFLCKFSFLRKYKLVNSIQNLFKIIIIILYTIDFSESNLIILLFNIFFGIISIYDFCLNFPFRDKKFCLIYISGSFFLIFSSILILILIFVQNKNHNMDIFYLFLLVIVFSIILAKIIYEKKYFQIMKMNIHEPNNINGNLISFYFEEIAFLFSKRETNKKNKLKLIYFLANHKKICQNPNCYVGKNKFFSESILLKLKEKKIIFILQEWFQEMFFKKKINKENLEFLHLKCNTMFINLKNNKIQAYSELKYLINMIKLKNKKQYFTKYFLILLEINIEKVEEVILLESSSKNELLYDKANSIQMGYFFLYLKIENMEKIYLNLMIELIEKKIKFWNEMIKG